MVVVGRGCPRYSGRPLILPSRDCCRNPARECRSFRLQRPRRSRLTGYSSLLVIWIVVISPPTRSPSWSRTGRRPRVAANCSCRAWSAPVTLPRINTGTYDKIAAREQYRTHLRLIQKSHPAIVAVSGLDPPAGWLIISGMGGSFHRNTQRGVEQPGRRRRGGTAFVARPRAGTVPEVTP